MARPPSTHPSPGSEAAEYFQALVSRLGDLPTVEKAVLLDRAGRVIARHGVTARAELTQIATLSAGLHATSARLSEMADDPGRSILRMETGSGLILLIPLPRPSTYLLLIVLATGSPGLPGGADRLLEEIAWVDSPGWSVTDPLKFEDSLVRSLDETMSEVDRVDSTDRQVTNPDEPGDGTS